MWWIVRFAIVFFRSPIGPPASPFIVEVSNITQGTWRRLTDGMNWFLADLDAGASATIDVVYHLDGPSQASPIPESFQVKTVLTSGHLIDNHPSNNTDSYVFIKQSSLTDPGQNSIFSIVRDDLVLEKIYPNPSHDKIFISLNSPMEQEIEVQIFDAQGGLVKVEKMNLGKGKNNKLVSIAKLHNGFYSIFIPDAKGKNRSLRFVKIAD